MPATTGGLTPISENLFAIGWAKQTQWGTAVAPAFWWQWLDGTDGNPMPKFKQERQGDTSPDISLVWKTGQWWEIKIVEYARPITAGCALQALHGSGSDAFTAPAKSTTLSAPVVAGATSFSSTASLGNTGTGYINFTPGYSSATYEALNVNLASQTGTGPYTYNLVAGQTFKNAHASSDPVTSGSIHTFTRQPLAYDAYSLDLGFGSPAGGIGQAIRVQDAVCVELDIDSQTGEWVKFTHTWYGCISSLDAALSTPIFEGQNVPGLAGAPFLHSQAQGNWTVDGATSGNAATVSKFSLKLKNSTAADEFQTTGLSPAYFRPGTIDRTGTLEVKFVSFAQYLEMYFGSSSATTGAQDSYLTGVGSLLTQYVADGINSLKVQMPAVSYTAGKLTPKLDDKPLPQQIAFTAQKTAPGVVPHTITLGNSQASQY